MDIYYGFYQATQLKRFHPLAYNFIFLNRERGKQKSRNWGRSAKRILFFFFLNLPFNPIFLGHQDLLRHIDPKPKRMGGGEFDKSNHDVLYVVSLCVHCIFIYRFSNSRQRGIWTLNATFPPFFLYIYFFGR